MISHLCILASLCKIYRFQRQRYSIAAFLCLIPFPTGTIAGGYASDVYHLLFRTRPQFMLEDKNKWGNPKRFIERNSVLEKITTGKNDIQ